MRDDGNRHNKVLCNFIEFKTIRVGRQLKVILVNFIVQTASNSSQVMQKRRLAKYNINVKLKLSKEHLYLFRRRKVAQTCYIISAANKNTRSNTDSPFTYFFKVSMCNL